MDKHLKKHLSYANGYRQLGMFSDAHQELAKIDPEYSGLKEVVVSNLAICSDEQDWERVSYLGKGLVEQFPDEVEWWIQWAYALRRCNSVDAAREVLEDALHRFPKEACIYYNLGCYACVDGDLDRAKIWLSQAIALEKDYKLMAMEDEDLVELVDWISEFSR